MLKFLSMLLFVVLVKIVFFSIFKQTRNKNNIRNGNGIRKVTEAEMEMEIDTDIVINIEVYTDLEINV